MCPRDGWVCIRNSELMCGNLCKASLGGSRSGLFYCLIRDHSQYVAANVMNRLSRLSARWIGTQGKQTCALDCDIVMLMYVETDCCCCC